MMDWNTGWGGSGSNLIFMGAMMLFWIAVVGVGIWLVLRLTDRDHKHLRSIDTPKAILDRRYAHGEIKLEQYVEARKHIDAHDLPA
jgi:putative membrane protein